MTGTGNGAAGGNGRGTGGEGAPGTPGDGGAERSLITYPCEFPIKVMGAHDDGFEAAVLEVARRFDPTLDAARVERRTSSGGRYLGLTLHVNATSREQLDDLYRALTSHPRVKVVL